MIKCNSPYLHCVLPQVGHFLYAVNGENVLEMNHRDLAHLILDAGDAYITLVIMEHTGDEASS